MTRPFSSSWDIGSSVCAYGFSHGAAMANFARAWQEKLASGIV